MEAGEAAAQHSREGETRGKEGKAAVKPVLSLLQIAPNKVLSEVTLVCL